MKTGHEKQFTDTAGTTTAFGWSPFDNRIYFSYSTENPHQELIARMTPTGEVEQTTSGIAPIGRMSWSNTGAWVGSANALPGERVKLRLGMADAEELADVKSAVKLGDLAPLGTSRGVTIRHWNMRDPMLDGDVLSLHAFAPNPMTQNVSGPAHLFDLWVGVPAGAQPDERRPVSFQDLVLTDKTGKLLPRLSFSGSVRTIPCAALSLAAGTGHPGRTAISSCPSGSPHSTAPAR